VAIDLFLWVSILGFKLVLDENGARLIGVGARVILETYTERDFFDLFRKQIPLVEEEDHGSITEPPGVADFFKQIQGLNHSVGVLILVQHLIIFTDGSHKEDCGDIFKTMNPFFFLSFR